MGCTSSAPAGREALFREALKAAQAHAAAIGLGLAPLVFPCGLTADRTRDLHQPQPSRTSLN